MLFRSIHLAFAVTHQWAAAYAAKHGLREEVDDDDESDYEDECEDEEKEKEVRERLRVAKAKLAEASKRNSLYDVVDIGWSFAKIVDHINENAGIESFELTRAYAYPYPCILAGRTRYALLSIRTNYDDGPMPTMDDIISLYEYLEVEDFAAWHLDGLESGWKRC